MTTVVEREVRLDSLLVYRQMDWAARLPRLAQGLTGRSLQHRFDFPVAIAPASSSRVGSNSAVADGWDTLARATGISRIARCRQVHGSAVALVEDPVREGVCIAGGADALVTDREGILLAVTVADCVPVFFVDPERPVAGLAHAGWRGTAAGIVGATLETMKALGSDPGRVQVHLGPAICGKCYEVGPDVLAALGEQPLGRGHVDLREHIVRQIVAAGVSVRQITVSGSCTRCEPQRFFSYRGGDRRERMCAFVGWRAG